MHVKVTIGLQPRKGILSQLQHIVFSRRPVICQLVKKFLDISSQISGQRLQLILTFEVLCAFEKGSPVTLKNATSRFHNLFIIIIIILQNWSITLIKSNFQLQCHASQGFRALASAERETAEKLLGNLVLEF